MMLSKKHQQGYFLLLAVVLIFVIGIMGTVIAYIVSNRAMLSVAQAKALTVFYNAESGLEIATRYLTRPGFSSPARVSCAALNSQLANVSFNSGTFTATGNINYAVSTLSGTINATATSLTLTSSAGFANNGRVSLDSELMDYAAISGNTLVGLTRGAGSTRAASHASGASVGQYQCAVDVQSGVPNLTSPNYQRDLQWNVQLQNGFLVGHSSGSNFTINNWNKDAELVWTSNGFNGGANGTNLTAISMLSDADGWAVGERSANSFIFVHWNGNTWSDSALAGSCNGQNLLGVSMISSSQGFAVGARYRPNCANSGNYRYTLLRWNGSAWSLLTPSTSPSIPADASSNQNLNAIHVIDTSGNGAGNIGFAVGNNGTILQYNGSHWVTNVTPGTDDMYGVYTVSASEAWAVGQNGTIWRWNGSSWSDFASPVNTRFNSISMYDTNGDGLADFGVIGANSARLLIYNGTSWTMTDLGNTNIYATAVFNEHDAWAAGASGDAYHWDGSSWTAVGSGTTRRINGMSVVVQGNPPRSLWRQTFN